MMQDQVVITAVTILNNLGSDHETVWNGLLKGECPEQPHPITHPFPRPAVAFYGIEDDLRGRLGGKGWRHHQRAALMACLAGRQVLAQAGLDKVGVKERAVVVANGQNLFCPEYMAALKQRTLSFINPPLFINLSTNATASQMTIDLGIEAFSLTITSGFTAGLEVFHFACQALHSQRANLILTGGVEQAGEEMMQSLMIAKQRGRHSLVFDEQSLRAMSGEGCALAAVEHRSQARAAGRKPVAMIAGFGMAMYHEKQPSGRAFKSAITRALAQAGLEPQDLDAVFLNANGDGLQEQMELEAIAAMLPASLPAVALKGAWGETYHAGASMAVVAASLALKHQVMPPTCKLHAHPPAGFKWHSVPLAMPLRHVIVLAAEGTSKAAALILSRGEQP